MFLIVGPPAVGKSTTARALAAAFDRSIHVRVDDLRHQVVGGVALPAPEWTEEIARQVTLAREAALRVADVYGGAGFVVVIDDFCDPLGMREYRQRLGGPGVHGIVLAPAEAEARARSGGRSSGEPAPDVERGITHGYATLSRLIDRLPADGWLVLDTTRMDVQAVVRAVLDATGATPAAGHPSNAGGSSSNSR